MKTRYLLATIAVPAGLLLGACSSSSDHGSTNTSGSSGTAAAIPADADFNKTDVGFTQGMIPHHAQAIEMAEMAIAQSKNADVLELATQIKAAQGPEMAQMTGWLETWGQKVPETSGMHDMAGMDSMMMSGMMTDADMQKLGQSMGTSFDRMWLEMMVLHHEGAITMANDEIAGGKSPDTIALARKIISGQQTEIDTMNRLIAVMPS